MYLCLHRSNYATTSDLALLAHRLDALESSLIKSGSLMPADLEQVLKNSRATLSGGENVEPALSLLVPPVQNDAPSGLIPPSLNREVSIDDTEGAALTLEHLAFGRSRMEGGHAVPHFGPGVVSTAAKHVPNNDYHRARKSMTEGTEPMRSDSNSSGVRRPTPVGLDGRISDMQLEERDARVDALLDLIGPTDVFDLLYKKTDVVLRVLTKALPSRERGGLLVRAVSTAEIARGAAECMPVVSGKGRLATSMSAFSCPPIRHTDAVVGLHVPTFMRQCNDLWSMPTEMVVHELALPFIALYFTTCAVS